MTLSFQKGHKIHNKTLYRLGFDQKKQLFTDWVFNVVGVVYFATTRRVSRLRCHTS